MESVVTNTRESFFEELKGASGSALLLDFDGTLAPFQSDRRNVLPYPGVTDLLTAIMASTTTRVAFISGRSVMELKSLLPIATPEVWGSHGLERLRTNGSYELAEIPLPAMQLLGGVDHCLEAEGLRPIMELKPGATALHWRGISGSLVTEIRTRVLHIWNSLRTQSMLSLSEFDGGMEFRVRLRNKGDAVSQLLRELREEVPVAYLGDDHTDEDAFDALRGRGLSVLVRDEFRPTAADIWIQPPDDLLQFLGEWLLACGGEA